MEAPSVSSAHGSGKTLREVPAGSPDKPSFKLKIPAASAPVQKPTRYKEKFQALRDKYNEVTAVNAEHHRSLEIAEDKMRRLQAENDLLLDAIHSRSPRLAALVSPHPPPHLEPALPPPNQVVPSHSRRHREREELPPQPIPHRRGGHREEPEAFDWPRTSRRESPPPPQHSPPEPRWVPGPSSVDRTPDIPMGNSRAHSPIETISLPPAYPPTNGSRNGRRSRRSSMISDHPQNGHDRFIEEQIPREPEH